VRLVVAHREGRRSERVARVRDRRGEVRGGLVGGGGEAEQDQSRERHASQKVELAHPGCPLLFPLRRFALVFLVGRFLSSGVRFGPAGARSIGVQGEEGSFVGRSPRKENRQGSPVGITRVLPEE